MREKEGSARPQNECHYGMMGKAKSKALSLAESQRPAVKEFRQDQPARGWQARHLPTGLIDFDASAFRAALEQEFSILFILLILSNAFSRS